MPTTKVLHGQTWIDIALQEVGDEHRLFELCDLNNSGITDDIAAGYVATTPDFESNKKSIVNTLRKVRPASGISIAEELMEGIEYWGIEFDFVVS